VPLAVRQVKVNGTKMSMVSFSLNFPGSPATQAGLLDICGEF